jgi:hypothetical protein
VHVNQSKKIAIIGLLAVVSGLAIIPTAITTTTPAAYAHDLTEEDLLSLQVDNVKVTICHIPPGEPANRHEITIGAPAVPAHIRNHGDTVGPCEPDL